MIKIKHLMDDVEPDDGARMWVEPIGLTKDFVGWCHVHGTIPFAAPPVDLWRWFEQHPLGYEHFRGRYHEYLSRSCVRKALWELARVAVVGELTLLHQGFNPEENTATALHEFLNELSAYSEP